MIALAPSHLNLLAPRRPAADRGTNLSCPQRCCNHERLELFLLKESPSKRGLSSHRHTTRLAPSNPGITTCLPPSPTLAISELAWHPRTPQALAESPSTQVAYLLTRASTDSLTQFSHHTSVSVIPEALRRTATTSIVVAKKASPLTRFTVSPTQEKAVHLEETAAHRSTRGIT